VSSTVDRAADVVAQHVNGALRRGILAAARSRRLDGVARKHGMRLGAQRFVAGETFAECAEVLAQLNARGLYANTTLLGEDVMAADETRSVVAQYVGILDGIAERGLRVNVALKLTHLGLLLDEDLAYDNLRQLVDHAASRGNFIRIDMEHSGLVDQTLGIYRRLRADGRDAVGAVLQAYLFRTPGDLEALAPLRPNLRLVKGAYLEPPEVAFPRKADTDENFFRICTRLMSEEAQRAGVLVHIATHDIALADRLRAWIAEHRVPTTAYEFAMLYGIQRQQQLRLARAGIRLRVLISYGEFWFPWYMRRLAERPANVWFVLKNLRG